MDNQVEKSMRKRKTSGKAKTKEKQQPPMKVVHISNPMKFNISASEFRALVQQLTGQYSELPADPSKFILDTTNQTVLDHVSSKTDVDHDDDDEIAVDNHVLEVPTVGDLSGEQETPPERIYHDDDASMLLDSMSFDDYFMPRAFENFYYQGQCSRLF